MTFTLRREDFSFVNTENKPFVEAGDFTRMIGGSSDRFALGK